MPRIRILELPSTETEMSPFALVVDQLSAREASEQAPGWRQIAEDVGARISIIVAGKVQLPSDDWVSDERVGLADTLQRLADLPSAGLVTEKCPATGDVVVEVPELQNGYLAFLSGPLGSSVRDAAQRAKARFASADDAITSAGCAREAAASLNLARKTVSPEFAQSHIDAAQVWLDLGRALWSGEIGGSVS